MKSLIRYKTKPESADENQRLVEKVYEELAARDPGGVRYRDASPGGRSHIHPHIHDRLRRRLQHAGRRRRLRRVPARAGSALRRTTCRPGGHRCWLVPAPIELTRLGPGRFSVR